MNWTRSQTAEPRTEATPTTAENYDRDMPMPYSRRTASPAPMRSTAGGATIGPSIHIEGTVSGNEDMTIDGSVHGKIELNGHALVVGTNGNIEADLNAKSVTVQGQVKGNITADDKVQITATGTVHGDLHAPRIALDDGANFTGRVDTKGVEAPQAKAPGQGANDR